MDQPYKFPILRRTSNTSEFGGQLPEPSAQWPESHNYFDPLNKITIAAVAAPKSKGERGLASELFLNLRPLDLVLLDPGYPAFWIFKLIAIADGHFFARIPGQLWIQVKEFSQSGNIDNILTFNPSHPSKKACRELGLDTNSMKLGLVRVALESRESEILITNLLDQETYPVHCFGDLYHHRWPVEEDFEYMKHRLELENFSGKSVLSVYQDFHAKVLAKNLAAVFTHPSQDRVDGETASREYEYQINLTQLLSKLKDTVVLLFERENIIHLIKKIIEITVRSIEPIRPNRKISTTPKSGPKAFPNFI